ncbi:MAG: PaaI family thioesterase [bacterium]|nr:PaaI family thioesterase [bacterium]
MVHGGIVTTLLDEAMAYALEFNGYRGLTVKLYIRFLRILKPKDNYKIKGYVDRIRGRLARVHSEVTDENGNIMAKAYGLFFIDNKIGGE